MSGTSHSADTGRSASRHVAIVMIAAALVSALLVGVYNYFTGRTLLADTVNDQLIDVATNRAGSIESGIQALENLTATLAIEPSVPAAIVDLSAEYAAMSDVLDPDQEAELEELYRAGIDLITPPGVTPPDPGTLIPRSDTGRYLQYWYVGQAPLGERRDISDPGDGSDYTAAHARHHAGLAALAATLDTSEILLIDLNGIVVYSIEKRADFATSLVDGPHADSGLGDVVDRLGTAAAGEVVLVDFSPYIPARGLPVLWAATAVRAGGEVVGALATPVPNDALVAIVTAGGDWEALGLGDTGEVYIVGPDGLLRSEARLWLEDPDAYLRAIEDAGYPEETIDTVRLFGTTVLVQPVDTDAVTAAQRGDPYQGTGDNYLDRRTRTVAGPFDSGGLGWIVVTEAETAEIFAPLRSYLIRLLIVAALAVPAVTLVATVIARRMLRPIGPIIAGADEVAGGDIDVTLGMRGNDEFSDLAKQFDGFVAELRHRRDEVERTDAETTELLASVMPERLVEQYRAGQRDIAEAISNATLISVVIVGPDGGRPGDDIVSEYGAAVSAGLDDIADAHGVERIDATASMLTYATGLGSEQLEIDRAIAFASDVADWFGEFATERELTADVGIGLAAGDVVANVIGTQRLAFEILGSPRRASERLARAAAGGDVLVDAVIAGRLGDAWSIDRIDGLRGLDGVPLEGWRVRFEG